MSLSTPYINPLPSLIYNITNTVILNVLGGDTIQGILYQVYNSSDYTLAYQNSISVTDTNPSSTAIRSFDLTIPATVLSNNVSYYIKAYTYVTNYSVVTFSNATDNMSFTTTIVPTISGSWYNATTSTWVSFSTSTVFNWYNINIQYTCSSNTSLVQFASSYVELYKKDSEDNLTLLYTLPLQWGNSPSWTLTNIQNLTNSNSYQLVFYYTLSNGYIGSITTSGILPSYTLPTQYNLLSASNNCATGVINLTCSGLNIIPNYSTYGCQISITRQNMTDISENNGNAITLQTIAINTTQTTIYIGFTMIDTSAINKTTYNYQLEITNTVNGVTTTYVSNVVAITSLFTGAYVGNDNILYSIYNSLDFGTMDRVKPTNVYEPLGALYPLIASNGSINYDKGTFSFLPVLTGLGASNLDRYGEVQYRKTLDNFLTQRKPMFIKDYNGNFWVITVTSNVSRKFYSELGNGIADLSLEWVEVGDVSQDSLDKLRLTQNYTYTLTS